MGNRVLSFALNKKGMGHASRLVAVHSVLRELGWSSSFFVGHEHRIIADYDFEQIVIPERTYGDPPGLEARKSDIRRAVIREVMTDGDVVLHDVVVHPELYELGMTHRCRQGYIYRERKDQADPTAVLRAVEASAVDVAYVLGRAGLSDVRHGIRVMGVPDVVRQRLGGESIWEPGDPGLRVLVTSGGGGHDDAESFLNAAITGIARMCADRALRATVRVVTGPYFRGGVALEPNPYVSLRVTSYVDPHHSLYADTDVIVSQGGYNTVQELKLAGVPAVAVAGERMLDDQHARLAELAARDHVTVSGSTPEEIGKQLAALLDTPAGTAIPTTPRPSGAEAIARDIVRLAER
ncbi:glycosyltransferase [Streptomyces viridochromogenes]|nr:glycosyltransferase [Streptomyces viridochromogenes]